MVGELERVQIKGLYGNVNLDIKLENNKNKLILVGENGSGKTTFLRILFYFLSGNWLSLIEFKFDSIAVSINSEKLFLSYKDLEEFIKNEKNFSKEGFIGAESFYWISEKDNVSTDQTSLELKKISDQLNVPIKILKSRIKNFDENMNTEFKKTIDKIRFLIKSQIVYLPTYRRIEREINTKEYSEKNDKYYIELVKFGMKDVQNSIDRTLEHLKDFARQNLNEITQEYLNDIVNRKYDLIGIEEISDEIIQDIFNRFDENTRYIPDKKKLQEALHLVRSDGSPSDHNKVVGHYF